MGCGMDSFALMVVAVLLFYVWLVVCFFFFFQAEDGIRDLTVTGVQTCALPISDPGRARQLRDRAAQRRVGVVLRYGQRVGDGVAPHRPAERCLRGRSREDSEIGRASCRERV